MPARPARLRVYYRSYGPENRKQRPAYYSKLLALASVIRAAQAVDPAPELIFVNDGPIPADRLALMRAHGRIVPLTAGSNRSSYRTTVSLAAAEGADDDLVWFAEDDYLYLGGSLQKLSDAVTACPHGDYFTMYSSDALDTSTGRVPTRRPHPGARDDPRATPVGDVQWFRAMDTTSTFGVRRSVLRQDARLLRLCPYAGAAWDGTTCRTYQGQSPFAPGEIRADLTGLPPSPRAVVRGVVRSVISARARRRSGHRRVLLGSDPELVLHMELDPDDTDPPPSPATLAIDWEREVGEVRRWAAAAGVGVPG